MPDAAFGGPCFSHILDLWLEVDGQRVELSHVEPDAIIARPGVDLPAGTVGTVVVLHAGEQHRRRVRLMNAMSEGSPEVRIEPIEGNDNA